MTIYELYIFSTFRVDLRSFRFIGNHFLLLMSHDFEEMNHTKSIYWKLVI